MNKALFWDFDGTLVYPSGSLLTKYLHDIFTEMGYDVDVENVRYHLSSESKGFTWHTPEISYTESTGQKWWDKLFCHLSLFYKMHAISKDDWDKINIQFKSQMIDHKNCSLYENTATVLCKCAEMGFKNYVLSNNYPELPLTIKDLGLADYFTDYVVSANVGYEKPRIEIFQYALDIANMPDICYMIGDNPVADIQGGNAVGMKTILLYNDDSSEANYKCNNLCEIPLLLTP